MATPNVSALTLFSTLPLTGAQENANKTQLVNWLADRTANLSVGSMTLATMFLLPKYTATQITALVGMIEGSMVYDTTAHAPRVYNGASWKTVTMS
jgi:hypothetical protein